MKSISTGILLCLLWGCAELADEQASSSSSSDETLKTSNMRWVDPSDTPLTCSPQSQGHDPNSVHDLGNRPHFEGWYYRMTHPRTAESWVLIAAYWLDESLIGKGFVKLIHGPEGESYTQTIEDVDVADIQANAGQFSVQLGNLWLSAEGVVGTIDADDGHQAEVDMVIDGCARWGAPFDDNNRWTMGWATEAPGVPLRWHVHHLKGQSRGTIRTYYGEWPLDDYSVHQEKNWGRAFPTGWIWFQANDFKNRPDVAFAAAGGPIFPTQISPSGYMAGLRVKDQFFNWRTQDGHMFPEAKFFVDERSSQGVWRLVSEGIRYRLEVDVQAPLSELIPIDVPTPQGLRIGAVEHLAANMKIKLYERGFLQWNLVDEVETSKAAVEVGGNFAKDAGLIP